ncbi:glycosyltransferase [Chryseobacterium sp. WX]|uniref:glycosyltransferase n=1 Tax=Chryseobacterium sp. WX TaxID=3031803 RepID=UPI0024098F40|nr:glycosyltransferase [Chryseobacterium sp. WX]WFB69728.1 glycosyltransferase [Chryseobacterium sp. WX]
MNHILYIPSWYPNQYDNLSGVFFKEQIEGLSSVIENVGVIAPVYRSFKSFNFKQNELTFSNNDGVNTFIKELWHLPGCNIYNRLQWFNNCKKLFENYVEKFGYPDLIHIHSIITAGQFAVYAKKKYNIPFVVTEHSSGFDRNLYSKRELMSFKAEVTESSHNFAVSKSLAEVLAKSIGGTWDVLPNWVNDNFINQDNNFTKKGEKIIFFSLSSLNPLKGLNILIDAFDDLAKEYQNVELWIGGNGVEYHNLSDQIKKLRLEDKIVLLGKLDRDTAIEKYKSSTFYVSPSLIETFGIVVIEALAMGLPVLATDSGGPQSILNNDVGIIVKKNSREELYKGMKYLIENEDKFDREKIVKYCVEHFSREKVSNDLINVYKKILKS